MLDVTQQTDKPQDYINQVFIGRVVVNDDIKKFHRIKVEIPDMWDGYEQEHLPWCIPDHLSGGCGPTEYSQNIPETGSFVYVIFQNGDNHFPVYRGGVRDYNTMQSELHTNYPHRIGWDVNSFTEKHKGEERKREHVSKESPTPFPTTRHHFYLDRSTNDLEYRHSTGTKIHIFPNGNINITVKDHPNWGGGTISINADWDINLTAGNDINLTAARNIKMVAGTDITQDAGSHIADTAPRIDHN